MSESVVLLLPESGMDLAIETEIARELLVREADRELPQVDAAAASRDLPALSTSIAMCLVHREAEAVGAKARLLEVQRASETGVAAEIEIETGTETETEIEIRTERLDVLGMRRSLVVGVGLEAEVGGEIGIGRRRGAEAAVLM